MVSAQHFDTWWKRARRTDPDLLTFTSVICSPTTPPRSPRTTYPDSWTSQSPGLSALPLSYAFEPGSDADGVTVDIPLRRLNQVNPAEFSWQIPGLREPSWSPR